MRQILLLTAALAFPLSALAALPQSERELYREGEVLVKYRGDAEAASAQSLKQRHGLQSRGLLIDRRHEALELPAITTTRQAIALLRADPAVEYAEPNYLRFPRATTVTPDDPLFGDQWGMSNTGQANFVNGGPAGVPGGDMHMPDAWAITTGDGSVTVAVVDDGVLITHPDLAANMVTGRSFTSNNGAGGGNNGSVPTNSVNEHGTLVAGCIGAVGNNTTGVAGVAWNVKLMPLKFDFSITAEVHALEYAIANGAKIVNGSFGGPEFSQTELDAINDLEANDILFVVAAGNEDSNTDIAGLAYPANYNAPNVMAVAATNREDEIASFSTYGPTTVDVAAPGLQIITTSVDGGYTPGTNANPGVAGTSFASPYTAGVAALLDMHQHQLNGTFLGYAEMKARLIEGADGGCGDPSQPTFCEGNDPTPAKHRTIGGRVNAKNSLNLTAQPSIVIQSYAFSAPLDPNTTPTVDLTLQNDWADATAVVTTLHASTDPSALDNSDVTVTSGSSGSVSLVNGATTPVSFDLAVASGITQHKYVYFTLHIAATSYATDRHFIGEIGHLANNVPVLQSISDDLYDEFQTWTFDVPAGTGSVTFTTSAAHDIDLLVKQGSAPRYQIELACTSNCVYCTSDTNTTTCRDPDTFIAGSSSGNERLRINHPDPGTYYVTVVNYADDPQDYTLTAKTGGASSGGGGGGGAMPAGGLALLLAAALARRRRSPAA